MATSDIEIIYRQIKNKIVKIIPEPWGKIFVYAEVENKSTGLSFFYQPINIKNQYVYFTEIHHKFNTSVGQENDTLIEIYKILNRLKERCRVDSISWTNVTLIFDKDKNIQVEFGHDDNSKFTFEERKQNWENIYICLNE
ncbi:MAG TPA: immunity protein YezG family protein, partial [Clostridia bacterium]